MAVNFISSKDTDEGHVMYLRSDNIEIMINDKTNEVTEELFSNIDSPSCIINKKTINLINML